MKYLVIFLVLVGIAISPYLVSNSFGICVINEDWPDAPCYSKRGEDPSLNQMKQWWSQYYELKGSEWMESKKQELVQAIQNGNLLEWKKGDPDRTRNNVYMYYFVMGDVPNEDGLFAKEYYGIRLSSPLRQSGSGIAFAEIHCGIHLVLVQKYDDSPACVKPESVLKLVERGWTSQETRTETNIVNDSFTNKETITYPRFEHGVTEIINPDHEPMKYKITIPVIADTYLSRNIQQWNSAQRGELDAEYQKHGDKFYTDLGRLLMKNEMKYQMDSLDITNANDGFEVFSGGMLSSLPPHIGFSAVVYATDGNYYRLQGSTFANQVSYYKTTQLQFPDTAEHIPVESLLSTPQLITILPEDGSKARQEPSTLVIHVDNNMVEFFNNTPYTIRIQDSGSGRIGEEDTLDWVGPTILLHKNATMAFDKPGLIQWDARKAPDSENPLWWQTHAGGDIVVLSDDMSNFSREIKAKIAQKMLHNSDIPIVVSGAGNAKKVLKIILDPAVVAAVPNAEQYYLKRAHQIIPFDVDIVVDK